MTNRYYRKGDAMVKYIRMLALTLTVLLVATATHANDSTRGRWWLAPQIAEQIQLTDTEIQKLDDAYNAAHIRMIELRSDLRVEQFKLRTLMEQTDFDEAAVMEQRSKEKEAHARLADERFAFLLEVRKIIGHDRFGKLMEIRDSRRHHRHADKADDSTKSQQ